MFDRAIKPVFRQISVYLVALRPWSFGASLTPVALGSCLAYKILGLWNIWIFITTCITAISVHAAGNLVNSYYDFRKGIDTKKSDDRTLVDNHLSVDDVVTLGGVFYTIGCLGFLLLVHLSPTKIENLAFIYFGGLSCSFLYTGGLGLKYVALGDILIFLTFGPLTVLYSYIAQGGTLSWIPLLYAMPLAISTECVLHANNTRDMESDKEAGIVTLAILCGFRGAYALFAFLLFVPYFVLPVLTVHCSLWFILPNLTIFVAFPYEKMFRRGDLDKIPQKLAFLSLLFGMLYVLAVSLADSTKLPFFNQS